VVVVPGLQVEDVLAHLVGVVERAAFDQEGLFDGGLAGVLGALDADVRDGRARALDDRDRHHEAAGLRTVGHPRLFHLRADPAARLEVAQDRGRVLGQLFVHEMAGPQDREPLRAGDHDREKVLLLDRLASGKRDLLDLVLRALVHRDGDDERFRSLLSQRVVHFGAVVALALQLLALLIDVLEDEVLVEDLALEHVVQVAADGLGLDALRLEEHLGPDGDAVDRHHAALQSAP
jgi:hypothetical protein